MKETVRFRPLAAVMSLVALPAAAHHSPAQFDLTRDETLEGTVSGVSWRNPHVYFELDVTGPDGTPVTRRIEAGGASNMAALGFDANAVRVGERVVVHVKPNRRGGDATALGWMLTKADGTAIPLHVRAIPPTPPGIAEASSLAGTWVPQAAGFAALAAAAREWPLTDAGRAAIDATREARDASRSACVPFGPPALMLLPSAVIVELGDTDVRFRLDVMGAERIVHLDRAEHPADLEPSLHGDSIGRWDGDTLVVDTIGYRAHPDGYSFDLPSSASKHIVERFTLTADRKHIDYEAVVEDPEYLAAPVTHRARWDYRPEQKPSNVPCDRDAAGRFTLDE
ncbi:MAG TPA: DUF6152 family protein [Gammaproteobacteria bacterium]